MILYSGKVKKCICNAKGGQEDAAILNTALKAIDDLVWGVPLIVLILATGIYLTVRLKGMHDPKTSRCSALHGSE